MDCYGKVRLGVARSGWFWQSRIVKLWLGVASSGKFWQSWMRLSGRVNDWMGNVANGSHGRLWNGVSMLRLARLG